MICRKVYIFFQLLFFMCVPALSVRDYLRERAAESRHDEMSAYLMFIAGSVLFIGGVLETLVVTQFLGEHLEWVLFVPVGFSAVPGCILGLALTLCGLALIVFGLVAGAYFARDRVWYMHELRSASFIEDGVAAKKKKKKNVNRDAK